MKITRVGLDLAKDVFQVHAVDCEERTVIRRQLKRHQVLGFFARLDRTDGCVVGMEACCGADYWARELIKLGYDARIMNPAFVKPYVKANKNDARDAEAICEAVGRPTMRFVGVKSLEQHDLMLLHRQRERYVKQRTALANQIRGTLGQYGIVVSRGLGSLRRVLPRLLEDASNALTALAREVYAESYRDLCELDEKVERLDGKLEHLARQDPRCVRLMSIPGMGALTATAWVGLLGEATQFDKARQCAAYLGLVPRQHSSGGKERLLGISKRGDRYLRTLLVHGARSALRTAGTKGDRRSRWIQEVAATHHANVAAVALANRNARTAWALLQRGETYQAAA
ncbi:MAG: IS110 family transposase [Phycisphaerae bacterium]|nr:IS110 family transposase [Phycisphaerae bacterium]